MSVPVYRIDAVMPYSTFIPRDVTVNTFHVECASMGTTELNTIHGAIEGFYVNSYGGASVSSRMNDYVSRATNASTVVTRQVGVPGAPLDEWSFTLDDSAYAPCLPFEVAVCLSYNSLVPGVPRGRSRGRIYIGPLNYGAGTITTSSSVPPTPATSFMDCLAEAASTLHGALSSYGIDWGVYSRVDEVLYPITGGYIDNEFDTQRRRQVDATARTTWAPV